jgi:hypothetical protein
VGQYSSDPDGPLSSGTGEYLDVSLVPGSTFTSVTITVDLGECSSIGGNTLQWWNGSGWVTMVGNPGPTYNPGPPPSLTVTLNGGTSPTLAQLSGTPFAVVVVGSVPAPSLSGTSTTNVNGTTNYVLPTVS